MPAPSTPNPNDPRRPNKIFRYKPLSNKPADDPTPDYMNLLGMIFSMCGLMMKVKSDAILTNDSIFSFFEITRFILTLSLIFRFFLLKSKIL